MALSLSGTAGRRWAARSRSLLSLDLPSPSVKQYHAATPMLRRGCTLILVLFGALFALYFVVFTRYFEWPGNLFAAQVTCRFH